MDNVLTNLANLKPAIEDGIKALELPDTPVELYEPIRYILSLGGKRMRPALTLMGCELFGTSAMTALPQALSIEVFHNFTLVHDDIMDEAPLRRNQPTVHTKWDPNIALLSGDVMLVYAYRELMKCPDHLLRPLMEAFNASAIAVCEGQQRDMNFETQNDVSLEEYTVMIGQKTGALLASSLYIGALMGGAATADAELLHQFGMDLGLAFQIRDDYLDVFGDPEKFGKQPGGDILANKKTWLLIKALEVAEGDQRASLDQWLAATNPNPAEKVAEVTALYHALDIPAMATAAMDKHYQAALAAMDQIGVEAEQKAPLLELAAYLMDRDH